MTLKLSDQELEQLLRGRPRQEMRPPADLLARLRADLPAELPGDLPEPKERQGTPPPARVLPFWHPFLVMAASLAVLLGGSFLVVRAFKTATATPELQAQVSRDSATAAPALVPPPAEEQQKAEVAVPEPAPSGPVLGELASSELASSELASGELASGELAKEVPPAALQPVAPAAPAEPAGASELAAISLAEKKVVVSEDTGYQETSVARIAVQPLVVHDAAAPLQVENPGVEGNALVARESPLLDRLESPMHQGDAGRRSGLPPPAPAASLPRDARSRSEGEEPWASSWRALERTLAEGRWPKERELEDARAPLLSAALSKNKTSTDADRENEPQDPVLRLMMDLLNTLNRKELSLRDLHEMRLRAVKLAELRPEDARVATVLRTLNLASRLLSD